MGPFFDYFEFLGGGGIFGYAIDFGGGGGGGGKEPTLGGGGGGGTDLAP